MTFIAARSPRSISCFLLFVTFTLSAVLLSSCGSEPVEEVKGVVEVPVLKLEERDLPIDAEFVGQTKGAVDADVRARVEGVILKINFAEGTQVKEGDLLYEIDPKPFEATVAEATAKLAEANTLLVKAQSDLKRIRPLAEMQAVSQRDLDSAVAAEGVARGGVDAAKAGVESKEIELGYTKITAPVSGLIGLTKARVGEFVGRPPNVVLLNTVSQLDPIHVRFTVTEKDYLHFARLKQKREKEGGPSSPRSLELILADDSVHPEKGQLVSVDSQIDSSTGSLTAEASFPNPGLLLRPGQYAKVRTTRETIVNAILIPKKAVRELQGLMQVMVVGADNKLELRTVKLGEAVGAEVVVLDGLKAGERIVAEPQGRLASGASVTPKIINSATK